MACYRPIAAWQLDSGEVVFSERGKIRRALDLPCGQCMGCRLERARQWAVRCVHESQMHDFSSFVTLTYNDESVPTDFSLNHKHFQLFMKRLRKWHGPARYFMCGEYGDDFSRPHFHACLFGVHFDDRYLWSETQGIRLWRSDVLDKLWPHGFSSIGDVTFESASYVAGYVTKKVTGKRAAEHYEAVDGLSGEVFQRTPEYSRMSLKPGIGANWFEKYGAEVYPRDKVVIGGREQKPPKFYDRMLEKRDGFAHDDLAYRRYLRAIEKSDDSSAARLKVREAVATAKYKFYNQRNKL